MMSKRACVVMRSTRSRHAVGSVLSGLISRCCRTLGIRRGRRAAAPDAVVRRDGSQRAEEAVVLGVRADPESNDDIAIDDAQRAMAESQPRGVDRPGGVHVFEVETWVLRVLFETAVGFTGPALDMIR